MASSNSEDYIDPLCFLYGKYKLRFDNCIDHVDSPSGSSSSNDKDHTNGTSSTP
jgi:hypothetical protein